MTALGIGSVVIGLALQDTLGSIAAGITLLFEQPFKKGDWLRVGDLGGKVTDINWRSVRIETIDMVQITIPISSSASRLSAITASRSGPIERKSSSLMPMPTLLTS